MQSLKRHDKIPNNAKFKASLRSQSPPSPAQPPSQPSSPQITERQDFLHAPELPRLMLWAWERPEDLRGIDPRTAGVAFLARTLYLSGDNVGVRPRLQPLRVAAGTPLVAVVRIETTQGKPPTYSTHQRSLSVDAISNAAQIPGLRGVQIDFDARASEREFYRAAARRPTKTNPSQPIAHHHRRRLLVHRRRLDRRPTNRRRSTHAFPHGRRPTQRRNLFKPRAATSAQAPAARA